MKRNETAWGSCEMWEKLAVLQLEHYKDSHKKLQTIEIRLQEINEEYIDPPHLYIEEETGLSMVLYSSVEDQVIWKMEAEEGLIKAKQRIIERCSLIIQAINQLDHAEQEALILTYLDDMDSMYMQWLLTHVDMEPIRKRVRLSLIKFYRYIRQHKREQLKAKMAADKQRIVDKVEQYLQ